MMKKRKLISFLSLTLVASLVFSACNFGGTQTGPADPNTLVMTEKSEPPNLDSAKSTDSASFIILGNAMEGLYRNAKDGKSVVPALAEKTEISDDKLTYTFKLRDAKWSDGVPVKAQDFEYAWKRALNPETASEYAFILDPIKNASEYNAGKAKAEDVGIKVIDDKTLQVTLKQPTPYFLDLLAFITYLPQRQDIVEKHGKKYATEANTMVYNGPFKLTQWNHNKNYVMEKNDQYWDKDTVKLQKIDTKILKEDAALVNAYETGQVQFAELSGDFIERYKDSPDVVTIVEPSSWYMEMNQTQDFFKNKKIRQAINLAVDKKTLVEGVLKNGSVPAGGLIPPGIKGNGTKEPDKIYREQFKADPQYDPAKAKQLFNEGLKELGLTKAPVVEMVTDDTPNAKRSAEFFKEQLAKNIGLQVNINSVPFKQRLELGKTGQFDLLLSGWNGDYNDPMTFIDLFMTGQPYNRGKWSNKEFDALVTKSRANGDFEQRLQDIAKAEQILIDEVGIVPLYYRSRSFLVKPEVQDLVLQQFGEDYSYKWAFIK